ncbi:MAG: DUF2069 domain-containing protein [Betaproteobacteria bacterium]
MTDPGERARRVFTAALAALLLLQILWEIVLAPIRPGAFWLALKALPLALLWPAVSRRQRRASQWALLLLPWYVAEGVVRVWSEQGRTALCAATSAALALIALVAGLCWLRAFKRLQPSSAPPPVPGPS